MCAVWDICPAAFEVLRTSEGKGNSNRTSQVNSQSGHLMRISGQQEIHVVHNLSDLVARDDYLR